MENKKELFHIALSDMKSILDNNKQRFFLACGTLLGQVRENDFIAWDDDIDIGVFKSEYNIDIEDIIVASGRFKLLHQLGQLKDSYEVSFVHVNGIRIDIFVHYPIDHEKNYFYSATFFGMCNNKKEGYCKWGVHIRGLITVQFSGGLYLAPANSGEYLSESYGDDWRTPKEFSYMTALSNNLYKNLIN